MGIEGDGGQAEELDRPWRPDHGRYVILLLLQARAEQQARNTEALAAHNATNSVKPTAKTTPDISFQADEVKVTSAPTNTFVQAAKPTTVMAPVAKATSSYDSMSEADFLNMVENG